MNPIPFDPYDFFGYLASGLVLILGMDLVLGFPNITDQPLGVVQSAILLLATYVAGQLVATPAKAILEDGVVGKILGRPDANLFSKRRPWFRGLFFPGYFKPLPAHQQDRIQMAAKGEEAPHSGEAFFLHVRYHPRILDDDKLVARLELFIRKYGFARNLAFTCLGVGAALLVKSTSSPDMLLVRYGWTAVVAGVLLFYRYLKFFRQYAFELFNYYGGLK